MKTIISIISFVSIILFSQGGDDDLPIVMINTYETNGFYITGAYVIFTKGFDTISGNTNAYGECQLTLPSSGEWDVSITKPGHVCIHTQVTILDSFTTFNYTLPTGQCF